MNRSLPALALAAACAFSLGLAPAPYTEEPVTAPISVGVLSGTLMVPSGKGPFPVALIIAGSGPTDRNGNVTRLGLTTDAYRKLAAGLALRGIATLRYDKRFVGASTSTQTEQQLRFDDYVDDALVLTRRLEADPRFSSVSIIGHSEGSLIGMVAANRDPRVAAYVSVAGIGRDFGDVLEAQYKAAGAPPALLAQIAAIDASLRAGKIYPSPDPSLAMAYRPSVQPYLISEFRYDPAKEIAKVEQPILIVQGTTDVQVGVADAKLLAAAAPRAKLMLVDGMNHVLVDAPADRAGNLATYSQPQLPLDTTMVASIAAFIRLH